MWQHCNVSVRAPKPVTSAAVDGSGHSRLLFPDGVTGNRERQRPDDSDEERACGVISNQGIVRVMVFVH
jgi:hypothetical protein